MEIKLHDTVEINCPESEFHGTKGEIISIPIYSNYCLIQTKKGAIIHLQQKHIKKIEGEK